MNYKDHAWAYYTPLLNPPRGGEEFFDVRIQPYRQIDADLQDLLDPQPGARYRILDVGAGPLTTLGTELRAGCADVMAVDALADTYKDILKNANIAPPVPTMLCRAEYLRSLFASESIDLVYCRNAFDHLDNPEAALAQMFHVCRGTVYIWCYENEGMLSQYREMHQWNVSADDRGAFLWNPKRPAILLSHNLLPDKWEWRTETEPYRGRRIIKFIARRKA